ncbi:MAG: SRPBCC family protein [Eudoraea sp.]|nr:SRPBCC family protein [Eudoraea sp.]
MKFSCTTIINASQDKVLACFLSEEVMKESQQGFLRKESLEGTPWEKGSTATLYYKNMELKETILINNLPSEFKGLYEHKNMVNTMHCFFIPVDASTTRVEQQIHYTEFRGFVPKMMARMFPGLFRKQVQKWLDCFKDVVEKKQTQ